MSNLRVLGILIGILGMLLSFRMFRGQRWNRLNFVALALFGLSLFIISIHPDILNILISMLNLEETARGRVLVLLICSNIILWFAMIYMRSAYVAQRLQFDKLVRVVSAKSSQDRVENDLADRKFAVLIPAYNEADNLQKLLPHIPSTINGERLAVLVIDDGSEDATCETAVKTGALAVRNLINRGGGAALRLGYDILSNAGIQVCITMDADCQHNPEEVETLVTPIINGQYDFVIGSRILGDREKDSLFRLTGIYVFSFVINRLLGIKISDPSSGFRAFRMDALNSIRLYEDQYHTSELIINAAKSGLRIGEVPITIRRRKHGKSKKGKDWKYGFHFTKAIVRSWWR